MDKTANTIPTNDYPQEIADVSEQLRSKQAEVAGLNAKLEQADSELQKIRSQLVQNEKLASVGQLAAGIAHEINNPVAFLRSNLGSLSNYVKSLSKVLDAHERLLDLAQEQDWPEAKVLCEKIRALRESEDCAYVIEDSHNIINESKDGANRVADIVLGLRNFSRMDKNELKSTDINDGIRSTLKIAWNELKYKAEVIEEFGEIPTIECFPGQINQVFLNLLVNAAQAVPNGGVITVRTYLQDGCIIAQVADNGCGIPKENLKTIFEPFFTTKKMGKGTGLGLSVSNAIVEAHGGRIVVDSVVGEGTTFTVRLPIDGAVENTEQ